MGKTSFIILILLLIILSLQLAYPRCETYEVPARPTCSFERNMSRQPNQAILVCK